MSIVVVGMLDEREDGLKLIVEMVEQRGHKAVLVDISIGTGAIAAELKPQISCQQVVGAAGSTIEDVGGMLAKERGKAVSIMAGYYNNAHCCRHSGDEPIGQEANDEWRRCDLRNGRNWQRISEGDEAVYRDYRIRILR